MQVGTVALEERMGCDREENIEVARRPATHTRFAFAAETDTGAVLHSGRDVDRKRALARHAPGART